MDSCFSLYSVRGKLEQNKLERSVKRQTNLVYIISCRTSLSTEFFTREILYIIQKLLEVRGVKDGREAEPFGFLCLSALLSSLFPKYFVIYRTYTACACT